MRFPILPLMLIALPLLSQSAVSRQSPETGALAQAVLHGDLNRIEKLILLGADPDRRDINGQTPLIYAVNSGRFDLVKRILETSADPDLQGEEGLSPLMKAVRAGREDLMVLLLNAGANPNMISDSKETNQAVSALSIAVNKGLYGMARRLLEAGADGLLLSESQEPAPLNLPICEIPLDTRIWRGLSRMRDNVSSPDWHIPQWDLHRAAENGNWYETVRLLSEGIDPNEGDAEGVNPLMVAAWHGHDAIAAILLQRGAFSQSTDRYGVDALGYAVAGGSMILIDRLLTEALQSNPIHFDHGITPLEASPYYWAVIAGRANILDRLIDFRLGLPAKGEEGITLLMLAAWLSDVFSISKFVALDKEAIANRDEAGRTALEWSVAAFDRDRRTGIEIGVSIRGSRNYPAARILARQIERDQGINNALFPFPRIPQ